MLNPEFPQPSESDKEQSPEILSGQETAEIISQIYEKIGPEWGHRLVESNVVLTVSGLKPTTEIHGVKPSPASEQNLQLVNQQIAPYQLVLAHHPGQSKKGFDQLSMINLKALEQRAGATNIPGMPKFDAARGFQGNRDWIVDAIDALEEAQATGEIPENVDVRILVGGIEHGYPDQAIWDFEDAVRTKKLDTLEESKMLEGNADAEKYAGAVPEFDYYPEHAGDSEITGYIKAARKNLAEFYGSDWFQQLTKNHAFQEAVKI